MTDRAPTTHPRYVRDLGPVERRWYESEHEAACAEDDPHPLEAHEPFDVEEGAEQWPDFLARLERHGLRLVVDTTPVAWAGTATDRASLRRLAEQQPEAPFARDVLRLLDAIAHGDRVHGAEAGS